MCALWGISGCWNPFSPPQEPGEYPLPLRDSVVLDNLQKSYMSKNLQAYRDCLDPDSFRFYFDPGDTGIQEILQNDWGIDSLVWGLTEELLSAEVLFASTDYVDLNLTQRTKISGNDSVSVWVCRYYLRVEPPPEGGSSTAEGRARFTMKKNPDNGFWYISRWEDFGGS